jgi:succinate dehydrogenase hydrophobic anchor subunit
MLVLLVEVSIRVEADEDKGSVMNVLGQLHEPLVFAAAVILLVLVFIHLDNENMSAEITKQVGSFA